MQWSRVASALGVVFVLMFAVPSYSAIFKWKDENGKIHFTDSPSKIPPKYRKKGELKTFKGAPVDPSKPVKLFVPQKKTRNHVLKVQSLPGGHYMAKVVINGNIHAELLVDTGATMIVLSDRLAERMGVLYNNNLPRMQLSTAGGKVEAPLFILDTVKFGSATVYNIEATSNPNFHGMDGLLGMSFLGEFKVEMDRERSEIILRPLAAREDPLWDGMNEKWWRKKFNFYARTVRWYQRTEYKARGDFQKSMKIKKLLGHYEKIYKALERRANRAKLPKAFRSYP